MRFLQPLYPLAADEVEYVEGTLQPKRMSSIEVRLSSMRGVGSRQMALLKYRVESPDIVMLSNDDIQDCMCAIKVSLETDKLFYVAFRTVAEGCVPFILSAPLGESYSPSQLQPLLDAATVAAKMGIVLEVCEDVAMRIPELQNIYEKCRNLGHVVAVPYYDFNNEDKRELHGVIVGIRTHSFPVTANAWARIFHYCVNDSMHAIKVARHLGKMPHYDQQSLVPRNDSVQRVSDRNSGWDKGVRVLTRERFVEYFEKLPVATPEEWSHSFSKAILYLGFADPYPFHPKRLYKKLQATHDSAAVALTEETLKSATELTTTSISQTWLDTLQSVLGTVTTIIPDAEKTFFVSFDLWSKCRVSHNLPVPLSDEEARAIGLVAQWAGFFGEAIFDTAQDNRWVFGHLRGLTQCNVSIVAIPVYSWEVDKSEAPTLHGVFVALRHPNAPVPAHATRLAWTLSAQYLLSPLAAKQSQDSGVYSSSSIVDSYLFAGSQPPSPDSKKFFDY